MSSWAGAVARVMLVLTFEYETSDVMVKTLNRKISFRQNKVNQAFASPGAVASFVAKGWTDRWNDQKVAYIIAINKLQKNTKKHPLIQCLVD